MHFRKNAMVNDDNNKDLTEVQIVNSDQEKKLSVYIKRAELFKRSISSPFEANSLVSEIRTHKLWKFLLTTWNYM